jgi:hypothetical protein
MRVRASQVLLFCTMIAMGLSAISCQSGPTPPQKGTPAFYWGAANETFAAQDYMKTLDHLEQLSRTENEYTSRAQPWRLVLASGVSKGYIELADTFDAGAGANRANPTPFRRQANTYRNYASQLAMQFTEACRRFQKGGKDDAVTLDFKFPTGNPAEVPQMRKIASGLMLQQSEIDDIQKKTIDRAVVLATCRAVGATDDTAKAQEMFKSGEAKVPRNVFVLAMANALLEQSDLYTRTRLDRPDRVTMLCNDALEALKNLPASKEAKELTQKLQKNLKKAR